MSDPRPDPDDPVIPFDEQLLHYFQTRNPTLAHLTHPNVSLPPVDYFRNARFSRQLDPFEDRVLWSFVHGNNNAITSVGSSNEGNNAPEDENPGVGSREVSGKDVAGASSKSPVVILPETPPVYSCKCCQVLRQITHTNGTHTAKLKLHGRLGIISHGIVENNYYHGMPSGCRPYEMFDFTKRSLVEVKEFLQQYMDERRLGRYIMSEDPLTLYYEAVCVGLTGDPMNSEDFFDESIDSDGDEVNQGPAVQSGKSPSRQKPSLAEQRERAAMLTVLNVAEYFHMPIEKASRRLKLCPTVVKKICRRGGVRRWPHRKVKSLNNKITKLRGKLETSNPEDRASIRAQIQSAQREVSVICFRVTRVNR